ncbi:MAG TPA: dihydrolipoamide succinyltransferase [Rhodospirillaceae bacterium]|jgi:2-oxoglutarate dehydrogenase E2 component (dihydrolipoamide succinyltransferase)|nr:dihydrolipoamide succinyltransferase [Rhodospirillaceae bacterium]
MVDIVVPTLGESVTEAVVARWLKQPGEAVATDEPVAELETDKVTLEVPAPAAGALTEIVAQEGSTVGPGAVLGRVEAGAKGSSSPAPAKEAPEPKTAPKKEGPKTGPAARKLLEEKGLTAQDVPGTGPGGRVTKGDVLAHTAPVGAPPTAAQEERVPMTALRRAIARRLKAAQDEAAILTTFNEVDMSAVMGARARYKESFEKRHGTRLGFMGFFVKAAVAALREFPAVGARIEGQDVVYTKAHHIGVAVSTPQGLVVPVVRDADIKPIASLEREIASLGARAREGALAVADMAGGTFTITNGGVFGSLLSTPILNPPQSGILGLHKIQQRPVVLPDGSIAARPMMYLALSYDHRIIDGREAVGFLVAVKEAVEDPQRLLLDI